LLARGQRCPSGTASLLSSLRCHSHLQSRPGQLTASSIPLRQRAARQIQFVAAWTQCMWLPPKKNSTRFWWLEWYAILQAAGPAHYIWWKKKCGGWRPCSDFRRLNNITVQDKYPLPNIGDLSVCLDGCVIFSKLDLQKGYYQVPLGASDVAKMAVIMPFGLFFLFLLHLLNAGVPYFQFGSTVLQLSLQLRARSGLVCNFRTSPAGLNLSLSSLSTRDRYTC
jgi:hypothetical protein